MKKSVLLFAMICFCVSVFGQNITGAWNGLLTIQSKQMNLVFLIAKSGNTYSAILDCPDQDNYGISISSVKFEASVLTIQLAHSDIQFVGKLNSNGSFDGVLNQAGISLPLRLSRPEADDMAIGKSQVEASNVKGS